FAPNVEPGNRLRIVSDLARRSHSHHRASVRAGSGSEIDNVIGAPNCFLVVLNHQHRVAKIAQRRKCVEQAPVVARMQSYRWLIEHVKHAAKLRSNLSSQANSLPFTARQSRRRSIKRQVPKTDRFQKSQPRFDLSQDESGNLFHAISDLDLIEGLMC